MAKKTKKKRAKRAVETRSSARAPTRATTDHREIRRWMESLGASPAVIEPGATADIWIELPGSRADGTRDVSWSEFFERFEQGKLALVYQERSARGRKSGFHRLVKRAGIGLGAKETVEGEETKPRRKRRRVA